MKISDNLAIHSFSDTSPDYYSNSQLRGISLSESGTGLIFWHNESTNQLQARMVSDFALKQVQNLATLYDSYGQNFRFAFNDEGQGLGVWSFYNAIVAGWQDPAPLMTLGFKGFAPLTPTQTGNFYVRDLSVDDQGKGWLLANNERSITELRSPTENKRGSHLFVIPVSDWKAQLPDSGSSRHAFEDALKKVIRLPLLFAEGSSTLKAAELDAQGDGIVVYADSASQSVKWAQVEDFTASENRETLPELPFTASSIYVRAVFEQGRGYLAWEDQAQGKTVLKVMPIRQGRPQAEALINLPIVPLDYSIDADGNGLIAWKDSAPESEAPLLRMQRISAFHLSGPVHTLAWPDKGTELRSAAIGLNRSGDGYLAFMTATCTWNGTGCKEGVRLARSIEARKIEGYQPL